MTFIGIQAGDGRPALTLRSAHLSPRMLSSGPTGARIALVSTTALLLGGDAVTISVDVGPGCRLELVDTAGTVAYDAQGEPSSWTVDIRVATGGRLLWKAEPLVVAAGADVTRTTIVALAPGAAMCLRETLVLGRSGEVGGALRTRTRVSHDGRALLAEDLNLGVAGNRERPGILGSHRVVDTVSLLGARGPMCGNAGTQHFELAGAGSVARFLGRELHLSGVPAIYSRWCALPDRDAHEK